MGASLPENYNARDYQNVNTKMADRVASPVARCKDCPTVHLGRAGRSNLLRSAGHQGCAAGKSFLCAGTAVGAWAAHNSLPSVPNGASVAGRRRASESLGGDPRRKGIAEDAKRTPGKAPRNDRGLAGGEDISSCADYRQDTDGRVLHRKTDLSELAGSLCYRARLRSGRSF